MKRSFFVFRSEREKRKSISWELHSSKIILNCSNCARECRFSWWWYCFGGNCREQWRKIDELIWRAEKLKILHFQLCFLFVLLSSWFYWRKLKIFFSRSSFLVHLSTSFRYIDENLTLVRKSWILNCLIIMLECQAIKFSLSLFMKAIK